MFAAHDRQELIDVLAQAHRVMNRHAGKCSVHIETLFHIVRIIHQHLDNVPTTLYGNPTILLEIVQTEILQQLRLDNRPAVVRSIWTAKVFRQEPGQHVLRDSELFDQERLELHPVAQRICDRQAQFFCLQKYTSEKMTKRLLSNGIVKACHLLNGKMQEWR